MVVVSNKSKLTKINTSIKHTNLNTIGVFGTCNSLIDMFSFTCFKFCSILITLFSYSQMAGFHPPGDPYYPNQGNGGWVEEDPEEDEEPIELEKGATLVHTQNQK